MKKVWSDARLKARSVEPVFEKNEKSLHRILPRPEDEFVKEFNEEKEEKEEREGSSQSINLRRMMRLMLTRRVSC